MTKGTHKKTAQSHSFVSLFIFLFFFILRSSGGNRPKKQFTLSALCVLICNIIYHKILFSTCQCTFSTVLASIIPFFHI